MERHIEGQIENTHCWYEMQWDVCVVSFLVTILLFTIGYFMITLLNN